MAIYRGAGGAGDATQDAASEVLLALQAKDAAIAAQVAAEAARDAAQLAETNAETAETNAETAETNAETAQTAAEAAQVAAEAVLTDPDFVTVVGIEADITTVAGIAADVTTVAGISADVTTVAGIDQTDLADVAAIDTDVTTVAGIATNVTSVAGIASDVTTVATNNANVTTVATDIANVNAVGSNIANVNAVAANETNINAVEANETNINTVAGISANVTTVAGISANVTTVAGISANVTTVAGIDADVTTVAGIDTEVTTVAGIAANVTSVAGNATNINTVATDIANVNTVGSNITNVNTVAGNSANINTVAGISANVTTVAGISSNVTTVATNNANVTTVATNIASVNTNATNIANINQNAANITAIQNASTNATNAANSATAAATSATNAATSAAQASAVALGNEPVRHSVRPSLLLDFANTRTLDPRITFTRGSTGTFYDGRTVVKAEENLLLRSQEFETTGVWSLGIGTSRTANTSTAPDGTTTADTITEDSAASIHNIVQNATSAGQITFSVFAKAGSGSRFLTISVSRASTHYGSATFNLATQTATQTLIAGYSGSVTTTVTASTQGFFRYSITLTTDTVSDVRIGLSATSTFSNVSRGFDSYTGDGTSSIILWGAQLEQRSSVTAYTATTTAPITNYIPALQTAAANVARFDHNPTTGESLGLLIEEQRANLFVRSDDFDNAAWAKTRSTVTSNTLIAPDGTLTGDKIVEDNQTGAHYVSVNISYTSGTSYTLSVYAKAGERSVLSFALPGGAFGTNKTGVFNLLNGTVTSGTAATRTITPVGNGWYRCSVSDTATTTASALTGFSLGNSFFESYTGDGYSGVFLWGAQLEAGAFATSYIPTVASQVTRSADVAVITGANFSNFYNQREGTFYGEVSPSWTGSATSTGTGVKGIVSTNNSATSGFDGYSLYLTGPSITSSRLVHRDGAVTVNVGLNTGYPVAGQSYKLAGSYYQSGIEASANGLAVATTADTVYGLNTQNQMLIGSSDIGGVLPYELSGTIRKIAYYPKRLTNAELQGLTTV